MDEADLSFLKPKVRRLCEALIAKCAEAGFEVKMVRGSRSIEKQDEYYAQGRTTPGKIITNARGGQSYHNYGVAFDIRPTVSDELKKEFYEKAGPMGEELGLEWGGRWTTIIDPPHFQYTAGYSIEDFKEGRVDESQFE